MEEKYTVAEEYELPSKGAIYNKAVNPHIRLRPMTVREEMKRTGKTNSEYRVLSEIIEACMIEKPAISVYDMHVGDFDYLLHKLRVTSHGPKYKMIAMCPFCNRIEEIEANLETEEVLEFDENKFNELRIVELPRSGKKVTLKFQTPRMKDNIKQKVLEMESDSNEDWERFFTVMESIDLVDDRKLSYVELESFINKLEAADFNKLELNIEELKNAVGLKNEIKYKCSNPKCKKDVITFFRYGPEFFRPTND